MRRIPVSRRTTSAEPTARGPRARVSKVDAELATLKRRLVSLARLDGERVRLADGAWLVRARGLRKDGARRLASVVRTGTLDRATLVEALVLEAPPERIDPVLVATLHRDLRVVETPEVQARILEHRRVLGRHRSDPETLARRRARLATLGGTSPLGEASDVVVDLVRLLRGDAEATRAADALRRARAAGPERRREARARIAALADALVTGADDPLAERLEAARELPGRARRRRVLEVLRAAVGWPDAPAELVVGLGTPTPPRDYVERIVAAGERLAASLPELRDPALREAALERVAALVLALPLGETPFVDDPERNLEGLLELAGTGLELPRALELARLVPRHDAPLLGRWVAEGLSLDLVREVAEQKLIGSLVRVPDARAARAYATWSTRLRAHYAAQGITFSLSPELFAHLPARGEDLGVLGMCLLEQADPKATHADPAATLDATLALFQRLPGKAAAVLGRLRGEEPGLGRALEPELAAWLDDDALLDRCLFLERLAGEPHLSSAIREDFEHATRAARELAYLGAQATLSAPQRARLEALQRTTRTVASSPRGRTRRRLRERIERLLPRAYRRELDTVFREILREVWGIAVPELTPAWRDAVRFWLVTDDNRELLGHLLRDAVHGRDPKRRSAESQAWIAAARFDVEAWLAPRTTSVVVEGKRFTVAFEDDPLEVLRMGIPFGTCLSLEDGCNAASTVTNAVDPNKRVVYARNDAGRVVARKLLAVVGERRLVGYNLYVAVEGAVGDALRGAVGGLVREHAAAAGLVLAAKGVPENLHRAFWYDDGPVPFEEDADVGAYCARLGLAPPAQPTDELRTEAHGAACALRGDVDEAVATLDGWSRDAANRALGSFVVDRLGPRAAAGHAAGSVLVALLRELGADPEGIHRALEVFARRPSEGLLEDRLGGLLAHHPPGARLAQAVAELGVRAAHRAAYRSDIPHQVLDALPRAVDAVTTALDVVDALGPLAESLTERGCGSCVGQALDALGAVAEARFAEAPDADEILGALASARRGPRAQELALRVAARHVLPGGRRALERFAVRRPEVAATPWGFAATLRQAETDRLDAALAARLPAPTATPFPALRELALDVTGLEAALGIFGRIGAPERWRPDPWELAWRRRRSDGALLRALVAEGERTPGPSSARDALVLLAAETELAGLAGTREGARQQQQEAARVRFPTRAGAAEAARLLRAQVTATDRGQLSVALGEHRPGSPLVDAGYARLAARTPNAPRALEVLLACPAQGIVDLPGLLLRADVADEVAAAILRAGAPFALAPDRVAALWQRPLVRSELVARVRRTAPSLWMAEANAAARAAEARGLDVTGLFDALALAAAAADAPEIEGAASSLPDLGRALATIAREAPADGVARTYAGLESALAASVFLRLLAREGRARAAAVATAFAKLAHGSPRARQLAGWLRAVAGSEGGLQSTRPSSIERE